MILLPKDNYIIKHFPKRGRGIVAVKEIPYGTVAGDYLGRVIKNNEEDAYECQFGNYIMFYNDRASIVPANTKTIGAHLFNHSCSPNCGFIYYQKHVLFFTLRKIFAGEELTIGYDIEPPAAEDQFQYPCFCSSPVCRGAMYISQTKTERWYQFIKKQEKDNFNKLPTPYGTILQPLKKYPPVIEDLFGHDLFANPTEPPARFPDIAIPKQKVLRRNIQKTGRRLHFPKTNLCVLGLTNDLIISTNGRCN